MIAHVSGVPVEELLALLAVSGGALPLAAHGIVGRLARGCKRGAREANGSEAR